MRKSFGSFFLVALLSLVLPAGAQVFDPLAGIQPSDPASVEAALNTQSLQPGQQGAVAVLLDIREGFHAQSHKPLDKNYVATRVEMAANPAITWYDPIFPRDHIEEYPGLGKLAIHSGKLIIYVPFHVGADASPGDIELTGNIHYQICDDQGQCLAPDSKPITIRTQVVPSGTPVEQNRTELFKGFDPAVFAHLKPAAKVFDLGFGWELRQDAYILAFGIAFLVGIIFNLMPCVLPVVPLKALGFYEVSQHHRVKCLLLGGVFSLGLITSFGVLAVLVVVMQTFSWGEQFSNPWFRAAIVTILLVMGLGMFGAFSVLLPAGAYRFTPRHDTYTGNFLFGILTAVLSTPCTAPLFVGLLTWSASQPAVLGIAAVMMVGIGMAFPYFLLSAFPELARRFPRTGPWAEMIKQLMGFLLIGVAIYFARPFFDEYTGVKFFWWTMFAIVAAAALFLVVRTHQFSSRLTPRIVAVAVAILITGPALGFAIRLTSSPLDWRPYSEQALADARATGRPVFLEFTASWCTNCQALEATVFHDRQVIQIIKQYDIITLRADLTNPDAPGWKLLKQLNPSNAVPLTVIYSPSDGKPIQLSGLYVASQLIDALTQAANAPSP